MEAEAARALGEILHASSIAAERATLNELRKQVDQIQHAKNMEDWKLGQAGAENLELKLWLNALIRLLIKKGLITAEELASSIAEARL